MTLNDSEKQKSHLLRVTFYLLVFVCGRASFWSQLFWEQKAGAGRPLVSLIFSMALVKSAVR